MKFIRDVREIYRPFNGMTEYHSQLTNVVNDFRIACDQLPTTSAPPLTGMSSFQDLVQRSEAVTAKLLGLIQECSARDNESSRQEAIRKTIKHFRNDRMIKQLEGDLNLLRNQMAYHVSVFQLETQTASNEQMNNMLTALANMGVDRSRILEISRDSNQNLVATRDLAARGRDVQDRLQILLDRKRDKDRECWRAVILTRLHFPELWSARESIKDPTKNTYEWTFGERVSPLKPWLESGHKMFWVSGKAGSGNSTFMKFLAEHRKTAEGLRPWAGKWKVAVISHYFRASGTAIQSNLSGFLRSMLFQIFNHCPEAIEQIFPLHGDPLQASLEAWKLSELRDALSAVAQLALDSRFCIFIDGLDEYQDSHGSDMYSELFSILQELSNSAMMKICASSRPYHDFIRTFGSDDRRMLVMHKVTSNDIDELIGQTLNRNSNFERLHRRDPDAIQIVREIRDKAERVFLWVRLMLIRVELNASRNLTTAQHLQDIRDLPAENMETFFQHSLSRISGHHQSLSARILLLLLQAEQPLPALALPHIAAEMENPEAVLKYEIFQKVPKSDQDWEKVIHKHQDRISNIALEISYLCGDLVEVKYIEPPKLNLPRHILGHKIDFVHRTARDFVAKRVDLFRKQASVDVSYDTRLSTLSLCRVFIGLSKDVGPDSVHNALPTDFAKLADSVIKYARPLEQTGTSAYRLLLELNRIGSTYRKCLGIQSHWTQSTLDWREHGWTGCRYLPFMTNLGTERFVRRAVADKSVEAPDWDAILDCSLRPLMTIGMDVPDPQTTFPRPGLVELALQHGANPNASLHRHQADTATVFTAFLIFMLSDPPPRDAALGRQRFHERLVRFVEPLLRAGADPFVLIEGVAPVEFMRKRGWHPRDADRLERMLEAYGKRQRHPGAYGQAGPGSGQRCAGSLPLR